MYFYVDIVVLSLETPNVGWVYLEGWMVLMFLKPATVQSVFHLGIPVFKSLLNPMLGCCL